MKGHGFFCEVRTKRLPLREMNEVIINSILSGNYLIKCKQMIMLWD